MLSDLGDRSEQGGRARPFFRSFEENSRSYLTKRIGKMGRSPTGAVDQSQIRQPPRLTDKHQIACRVHYRVLRRKCDKAVPEL